MSAVIRPQFCPLCGSLIDVVRHIAANIFEIGCEACGRDCVVLSDDRQKIQDPFIEAENLAAAK